MKKEKELLPFTSDSIMPGQEPHQAEYINYSRIEMDSVYFLQFEEEYENYNSDYDLNTK